MPNATQPRTIVAVTGEDDRYRPVRSRATALAAGGRGTVILYDIDAAGVFASPVPTDWSAEGERELTGHHRLDADELEAAGRATIAEQVRGLRSMGVDAWGWLPTSKDALDLVRFAEREGADLVLVPPDLEQPDLLERALGKQGAAEARKGSRVALETVPSGG
jgi:hypothetical protein